MFLSTAAVKVEIGNDNFYYGLNFVNCTYFKVTGTGDSNLEYGIELTGTGSGSAFGISGTSSDFEIEYVEISGSDFAGIFCKNDPNCTPSTWRENFVMKNVSIHNTYIHHTEGEGMYIGYSFYTGREITCNGETILVYPHNIENLRIFDNIVDSTGWDGIQVGCGTDDIQIFNNKITHYGLAKVGGQTSGIQIGGGTTGLCYNNFIKDGMGNGIAIFGLGGNILYNNVIVNAGRNYYPNDPNQRVYGIFCNDVSTLEGKGFDFINNTIVSPKTDGIRTYSTRSTNNKIYNNIIVNPGAYKIYENDNTSAVGSDAYIYAWDEVDFVMSNNYFDTSLTNVQFADIANDDYALLPTSPAIDGGLNVDIFGILTDFRDSARAYGTAYDIGAYETATTLGVTGCTDATAHNYNAKATISGTCLTCFDGLKNGDEMGIDCGGKCSPCANGCTDSNAHNYNATATTDDGTCETCSDGIQNGDETRIDCGGSCAPCAALNCGCDFVLGNKVVRANGATMGVQGGDRVCIEAGKRPYLRLENFVGDSLNYITFINCGGQAVIGNNFYKFDIQFENSKYFKLTGTGDANINYGIKLDGTLTDSDLVLTNKSTDFEIEKIEIANADFAGIMCKTDPQCDLSTNRGNFLMQNVKIHDNYIHHTGGEGLYIGHSFYTGFRTTCNGQTDTLYPHDIKNIEIYNNIIDHTGWDGMQVGCAVENCKIYNNRITNFATANEIYQNVGLVIGGGTSGDCYNKFYSIRQRFGHQSFRYRQ
ncbi:MAG: right-handed parallel beta-helix repeat-containing protein [Saprospiraceae bacterium]|nr:right-handed parallel beta-helix repeat-containing protein [Saprospiraceae bacterium]